ncbi:MAG: transposase [Phyllobacterium sp.]|uniref:IS66 family transposase n=1 Tax=Phyllobacterium sp. TaxID=1871046 RepID=UPI0030F087FF
MKKKQPSTRHVETLSLAALRRLVGGLLEKAEEADTRLAKLEAENRTLREENEQLRLENTRLKIDNELLRDEIARLKNLPPKPPFKSSGMDKATDGKTGGGKGGKKKPRGPKRDTERVSREEVLGADVPAGSRFKGYETVLVRELILASEVVCYKRERWVMPDGKTLIAPLPEGVIGGFGPAVRRFCLVMHAQGQVTTERLTSILNGIGIEISKTQVVRLLTNGLDGFAAEDAAVLHAGLISAPYLSVDDTGARHARKNCYTTQIGGERFCVFRATRTKSRLNFLSLLTGNYQDYVLNDAALNYLEEHGADLSLIARLRRGEPQRFANQVPFLEYLAQQGIDILADNTVVRALSEAGLWGAIRHHGLLANTVIISDDAGQFRVGNHGLCWVHAERLLQKLMPATPRQASQLDAMRDLVWCFYKALKAFKQKPSPGLGKAIRYRFDRIFRVRTDYQELDKLLARLHRRKDELLKVLDHPEIPLHTNASENDLRTVVTKRKISGGTMSRDGRIARDTMLGLMKTCRKLGLSFWHYLGDRLGLNAPGNSIPPLADLIAASS